MRFRKEYRRGTLEKVLNELEVKLICTLASRQRKIQNTLLLVFRNIVQITCLQIKYASNLFFQKD